MTGCLAKANPRYGIEHKITPESLRGDFDGDGKPDQALVVARSGKQGVLICRSGAPTPIVLGAGTAFHEMDNLDFTAWRIHAKNQPVARGAGARRIPSLAGDAIYLEWESASALVYWNGKRFVWYQQGD